MSSRDTFVSASSKLGMRMYTAKLLFYMVARNPDSHSHIRMTSTVPSEPSLLPAKIYKSKEEKMYKALCKCIEWSGRIFNTL